MKSLRGSLFDRVPIMQHALAGLVRWGDHLSTGNPAIDAQHRAIFNLIVEIDELWRNGAGGAQLRGVAERARRMLETHFRCEERMLAKARYPALADHAREHDKILEDLAAIRESLNDCSGIRPDNAGLRLCNFILNETMAHGITSDGDYCTYLTDETGKDSTGCA
jgi:hemerythrin